MRYPQKCKGSRWKAEAKRIATDGENDDRCSLYRPRNPAKHGYTLAARPISAKARNLKWSLIAMSSINLDELLSPVAADTPCGEDIEYDPVFAELEKLAQGTPERQYGGTIIPAEPPNWRSVRELALTLAARTRDLRVAVYLARSLLNVDGLAGFAEGLALVEGLLDRYWDEGVYPQLDPDDDNDPTARINVIVALCDPETTLRNLRETPLVVSRALGRFSLRDFQIAAGVLTPAKEDRSSAPTQAGIDAAAQDAALEDLQAIAKAVTDAKTMAEQIEATLTERIGATQAPSLDGLTSVLKEMRQVLAEPLRRRGVEAGFSDGRANQDGTVNGGGPDRAAGGHPLDGGQRLVVGDVASREDAIRLLDKICDYFKRYEPSSPVPFLLQRAKILISKDFMEILLDLAPSGTDQANLIFGIRDENSE